MNLKKEVEQGNVECDYQDSGHCIAGKVFSEKLQSASRIPSPSTPYHNYNLARQTS